MRKKLEQFRLPEDLAKQLGEYATASGMDKTEVVINALRDEMARGIKRRLEDRLRAVSALESGKSAVNSASPAFPSDVAAANALRAALPKVSAPKPATDAPNGRASAPSSAGQKRQVRPQSTQAPVQE